MYNGVRVSYPLQLELQTVVLRHVGAGNWTPVFWKSNQCSWSLSYLSSPLPLFILQRFARGLKAMYNVAIVWKPKEEKTRRNTSTLAA